MLQTSSHAGKQPACAQAGSKDHAGNSCRQLRKKYVLCLGSNFVTCRICGCLSRHWGRRKGSLLHNRAGGESACDDCKPMGGVCADYRSENAYITSVVARAHSHAPRAGHSSSSMMAPTASSSLSSSRRESPPVAISCSPISLGHSIGPFRNDGAMIKAMSTPSGHM